MVGTQAVLQVSGVAQDLLLQSVVEERADIAIINEVYEGLDNTNWVTDSIDMAVLWVCGYLHIFSQAAVQVRGFNWLEVAGIHIYSSYFPPSDTMEQFVRSLEAIVISGQSSRLLVLIAGDFNS
ncbi:uncharacterized protein [Hetaerina americana]|uniref:uncharacterized protein n=1 Tax=Hetaerina americana TaxID=62018 RepID=UPI003A7F5651